MNDVVVFMFAFAIGGIWTISAFLLGFAVGEDKRQVREKG